MNELSDLQVWYQQEQVRIDDNYLSSMVAIEGDYAKQLKDLEQSLTSKGDLEGILAVRKEKSRFSQTTNLTTAVIVPAPDELKNLQLKNVSLFSSLQTEKETAAVKLKSVYLEKLEELKKALTQNLKISEAVKVKEEINKVNSQNTVIGSKPATGTQAVPAGESIITYEVTPCNSCMGAGRKAEACLRCKGTGSCPSCNGIGKKPSAMRDSRKAKKNAEDLLVICTVCSGKGKCQTCKGSGLSDKFTDCTVCQGAGKIRKAVRTVVATPLPPVTNNVSSNIPAQAANLTPLLPKATPTNVPSSNGAQLEEYANTVKALRSNFEKGVAREIEFDTASASPDKYTGMLLKSSVYLIEATPRRITIGTSREDIIRGGTAMRADSLEAGKKAVDLFWSLKRDDKVTVTYGIINTSNIIYFGIEK
ncbi:MAG: hypothetical protein A2283_18045 [Lentisphaerae bacterium RIFOXYA12_FULL_48_11]|nr:MAG: hypothetical protein A2283_18045 [Lentisphaerae bacterium RIFOXYA12_FULL_48_11]